MRRCRLGSARRMRRFSPMIDVRAGTRSRAGLPGAAGQSPEADACSRVPGRSWRASTCRVDGSADRGFVQRVQGRKEPCLAGMVPRTHCPCVGRQHPANPLGGPVTAASASASASAAAQAPSAAVATAGISVLAACGKGLISVRHLTRRLPSARGGVRTCRFTAKPEQAPRAAGAARNARIHPARPVRGRTPQPEASTKRPMPPARTCTAMRRG